MSEQKEKPEGRGADEDEAKEKKRVSHRKDKPWDNDSIDHWKIEPVTSENPLDAPIEESSFATLFPKYREKYLREVWPLVTRTLKSYGVLCELNLIEGSMTVKTSRKMYDPYIIIKARDLIKLLARSIPVQQVTCGSFCFLFCCSSISTCALMTCARMRMHAEAEPHRCISLALELSVAFLCMRRRLRFWRMGCFAISSRSRIWSATRSASQSDGTINNAKRWCCFAFPVHPGDRSFLLLPRGCFLPIALTRLTGRPPLRARLIGPNGCTLKAIELVTDCYVMVQGAFLPAYDSFRGPSCSFFGCSSPDLLSCCPWCLL